MNIVYGAWEEPRILKETENDLRIVYLRLLKRAEIHKSRFLQSIDLIFW